MAKVQLASMHTPAERATASPRALTTTGMQRDAGGDDDDHHGFAHRTDVEPCQVDADVGLGSDIVRASWDHASAGRVLRRA